jgi:hypothetical protein
VYLMSDIADRLLPYQAVLGTSALGSVHLGILSSVKLRHFRSHVGAFGWCSVKCFSAPAGKAQRVHCKLWREMVLTGNCACCSIQATVIRGGKALYLCDYESHHQEGC